MFRRGHLDRGRRSRRAGSAAATGSGAARDLGRVLDPAEALLAEADATFEVALRLEQESYADALVEESERSSTLRDRLLQLRHGRAVRARLVDGQVIAGRVTAVGVDWFALTSGEGSGGVGTGSTWEVRIEAVSALEPGAGEGGP